jgi:hypothetical protein
MPLRSSIPVILTKSDESMPETFACSLVEAWGLSYGCNGMQACAVVGSYPYEISGVALGKIVYAVKRNPKELDDVASLYRGSEN